MINAWPVTISERDGDKDLFIGSIFCQCTLLLAGVMAITSSVLSRSLLFFTVCIAFKQLNSFFFEFCFSRNHPEPPARGARASKYSPSIFWLRWRLAAEGSPYLLHLSMCDRKVKVSEYDGLQIACGNLTKFTTLVDLWTKMNQLNFEFKRSRLETKYGQKSLVQKLAILRRHTGRRLAFKDHSVIHVCVVLYNKFVSSPKPCQNVLSLIGYCALINAVCTCQNQLGKCRCFV